MTSMDDTGVRVENANLLHSRIVIELQDISTKLRVLKVRKPPTSQVLNLDFVVSFCCTEDVRCELVLLGACSTCAV